MNGNSHLTKDRSKSLFRSPALEKAFVFVEHGGAGSDYPESVFVKDGMQAIVRLNAPLLATKPQSITVVINNGVEKKWTFAVDADREQLFNEFDGYC